MANELQKLVTEAELKFVAAHMLNGLTDTEIAKEMSSTPQRVQYVKKKEAFFDALKQLTDKKLEIIVNKWKSDCEAAAPLAWKTFIFNLEKKQSLEAVKLFVEMIGFKSSQNQEAGPGTINIIMPGTPTAEKTVEDIKEGEDE